MPIHGLPFPNRRKRNAVSGPGDQLALPGKQKSFFKPHVFPPSFSLPLREVRAAFKLPQAPAQKVNASLTQCRPLVRTIRRFPFPPILLEIPASRSRLEPHGTQKRRSRKNASSASTALPERQRHFPPIRQPERNAANGRLPAFRKCPPDSPSPATPARGGC